MYNEKHTNLLHDNWGRIKKNKRFMRPKIGMGDLPPPPVNKQVTPMVQLIQQ
jgi:hypothetical protein